jgi:TonB family protein
MLTLPARFGRKVDEPEPIDIVFYSPDVMEPEVIPAPELPEPEPVEIVEVEPPEPPRVPLQPEPPTDVAPPVARNEPSPPPRAEPVAPPPVPKPEPVKRTVRTAILGDTRSERVRSDRAVAPVGGFDVVSEDDAPSGRENVRVVANGSFSNGDVTVPREGKAPRGGSVMNTSFNIGEAERPAARGTSGTVQQGGFGSGEVAVRKPRQRQRPAASPDTPVAIISKPRPVYTDEARRLRIEGEVVLEVTFPASGQVRVLRVLGSLGHGLDEAAIEAAQEIEYKPARRDGRPVDHTATLRVVFRLA